MGAPRWLFAGGSKRFPPSIFLPKGWKNVSAANPIEQVESACALCVPMGRNFPLPRPPPFSSSLQRECRKWRSLSLSYTAAGAFSLGRESDRGRNPRTRAKESFCAQIRSRAGCTAIRAANTGRNEEMRNELARGVAAPAAACFCWWAACLASLRG